MSTKTPDLTELRRLVARGQLGGLTDAERAELAATAAAAWDSVMRDVALALQEFGKALAPWYAELRHAAERARQHAPAPERDVEQHDPYVRALAARRNRNTGPPPRPLDRQRDRVSLRGR